MWAGPEIALFRSWRLCVMWCARHMIFRGSAKMCRCGIIWDRAVVKLLGLMIYSCSLHALQNSISQEKLSVGVICHFFLCKTWCISLRLSTWSLHLWFRKPRTEAKDSLCGVGENVDLCRPENPHNWWLALAPPFPTHPPLFFYHVVAGLLIITYFHLLAFFPYFSYSTIVLCAPHLANNMSVENSEECILLLRWVILPLACMPLPQGGWMRGWWG